MDEQDPIRELADAQASADDPRPNGEAGEGATTPGDEGDRAEQGEYAACVHHAEAVALWRCPSCAADFCDNCVRIYGGREVRLAACERCGGMCESLAEPTPEEQGIRAGAYEDEVAVRQRLRRDRTAPAVLLGVSAFLLLLMLLWGRGPTGVALWLLTLGAATGVMGAGFWLAGLVTEVDFEPLGPTWLKLAAIGVAVHAARLGFWAYFDISEPAGMAQALALLFPLSITFVLAPMAVLFVSASKLFRYDVFDRVVLSVTLFLTDAVSLFFLLALGQFG